jgi:hypothetical protein
MYSWKTIRTVAALLLLIPIVHLAYLVSRETLLTLNNSPETWASEVEAYARIDQKEQHPVDPMVIVGGRRVALWDDLDDLLAPMPVLRRNLGDATTNDIIYYYKTLIGFYQPHSVVLFPGESEFHIRDNKTAQQLVDAIRELVELDLSHGVTQHFYVFSPLKTPLHRANNAKIEETSRLLKNWAGGLDKVEILDANVLLSDKNGLAKPGYFRNDGVNLNEHGYVRVSMMLRSRAEHDCPEFFGLSGKS